MNEADREGVCRIGAHLVWVEPPDLLCVQIHGDLSPDELRRILDEARRVAARGPILWLSDISAMRDVHPGARRVAVAGDAMFLGRAAAIIISNFTQRIMTTLVMNVAKLARPGIEMPPIRFFPTEAAGRAWLDRIRRDLGGSSSGS
jgi:hypothetical protein